MLTEIEEVTEKCLAKRKLDSVENRYFDPLHVPSAMLVVTYNGKEMYLLNKRLLDQQNCWQNLEALKEVHWLRIMFCEMILETNDPVELKELTKDITECDFELQRLWGFPEDSKFHRFWELPKCKCPRLDCEDAYPSGYYTINEACVLHGK